jgi:large subunit ribosomal protein L21
MQAIIRAGGKQYLVSPDQTLEVDLVDSAAKTLAFEPLLVIDGAKVTVGTPVVAGVKVTATVVGEVKGEKIKVLKFKAKKREKKLTGHRQRYTQIKISAIGSAKQPVAKAAAPVKAAKTPVAAAAK